MVSSSLSPRRKRGTGASARTNVSLTPRTKEIIANSSINFSAWAEAEFLKKFGEAQDDATLATLLGEREEALKNRNFWEERHVAMCEAIHARRKTLGLDEKPLQNNGHSKEAER